MMTILDKVRQEGDLSPSVLAVAFGNLAQATARQQRPNMAKLLSALSQSFHIQAMNDAAAETAEAGAEVWLGALQAETKEHSPCLVTREGVTIPPGQLQNTMGKTRRAGRKLIFQFVPSIPSPGTRSVYPGQAEPATSTKALSSGNAGH